MTIEFKKNDLKYIRDYKNIESEWSISSSLILILLIKLFICISSENIIKNDLLNLVIILFQRVKITKSQ